MFISRLSPFLCNRGISEYKVGEVEIKLKRSSWNLLLKTVPAFSALRNRAQRLQEELAPPTPHPCLSVASACGLEPALQPASISPSKK